MAIPGVTHSWICYSPRRDILGCGDHEVAELKILKGVRKESARVQILDFRSADLSLFRKPTSRIPGKVALKGKEFNQASRSWRTVSCPVRSDT